MTTISRSMYWRSTAPDAKCCAARRCASARIHPGLVKRLFEMEVPEIAAGVVQIKSIAREAGSRTKMAVHSTEVTSIPWAPAWARAATAWKRSSPS